MDTSGQLNTNTTYDSYFWVKWSQVSQDVATNKTKINWSCGVDCGHNFYLNAIKMSAVSINGVKVYGGGTYSDYYKGSHTIASGTLDIDHNTDGTKTFSISPFTGWLYSSFNYSSNGKSYELTAIPRQATITAAPDFTDVENPTISYSNPAGNAVTDLKACISFTGAKDDIAYRDISKTGETYTFELTDAERDVLRNNTDGANRTVIFYVTTTIGSVTYYSTISKKFTVTENDKTKPEVEISITLNNSSLPGTFAGMYIQGKSRVDVSLSAEGKYNADITRYSAQVDGKTYVSQAFTSDVIQHAGSIEIVGYARDSRNFTGSVTEIITVAEYSKPLVIPLGTENAIQCYRSDGNGKRIGNSTSLWVKAKRSHHSLEGKNACALQWRRKLASEKDDKYSSWSDIATDEYNGLLSGAVFDLKTAYTVQIRAVDTIGEYDIKTFDVPTQDVALHLGKGGKNVSVGTYCDYSKDYTFYSEWDATFGKSINDMYIKTAQVGADNVIRLKTCFDAWDDDGNSYQSFFVFGNADAYAVLGVCVVLNTGQITDGNITYITAEAGSDGVVILRMEYDSTDSLVIMSPSPFTIVN